MKSVPVFIAASICLASTGCVSGPTGSNASGNRTLAGVAIGSLLGGLAGHAAGNTFAGVLAGGVVGGAAGALIQPGSGATRGYCYTVDQQGWPIVVDLDAVECLAAGGSPRAPNGR